MYISVSKDRQIYKTITIVLDVFLNSAFFKGIVFHMRPNRRIARATPMDFIGIHGFMMTARQSLAERVKILLRLSMHITEMYFDSWQSLKGRCIK